MWTQFKPVKTRSNRTMQTRSNQFKPVWDQIFSDLIVYSTQLDQMRPDQTILNRISFTARLAVIIKLNWKEDWTESWAIEKMSWRKASLDWLRFGWSPGHTPTLGRSCWTFQGSGSGRGHSRQCWSLNRAGWPCPRWTDQRSSSWTKGWRLSRSSICSWKCLVDWTFQTQSLWSLPEFSPGKIRYRLC